jgi:hypothetical protein
MTTKTDDLTAKPPPVEQPILDDLRRRLRAMNRVRLPQGTGWERGVDADYLTDSRYSMRRRRPPAVPWNSCPPLPRATS